MRSLLDINVLIALLDRSHTHHSSATMWLHSEIHHGWSSCPITQNGCIRIMSQPAYPKAFPAARVAERLAEAARQPEHEFWPDDVNLLALNICDWSHILGHRQVTDVYLLLLAVRHGGRLATLDSRISLKAVPQARADQLVIIKS